jgi:hypothetical protein
LKKIGYFKNTYDTLVEANNRFSINQGEKLYFINKNTFFDMSFELSVPIGQE